MVDAFIRIADNRTGWNVFALFYASACTQRTKLAQQPRQSTSLSFKNYDSSLLYVRTSWLARNSVNVATCQTTILLVMT